MNILNFKKTPMLILATIENYTDSKEMKKLFFLIALICTCGFANAQKLYVVPKLTAPFAGLSYATEYNKEEFRPDNIEINFSWGFDVIYKRPKISHKFSFSVIPLGMGIRLKNKFMEPPYSSGLGNLGFKGTKHVSHTDQFALDYSLQKESKRDKKFLFNSRIRLNYSAGIGVGFNRSEDYYKSQSPYTGGGADQLTYLTYSITTTKEGLGLFLNCGAGFDFINKKNQRVLSFNVFYRQGIADMAKYNIHYQYGYLNDPSRQVNVPNQVIYTGGDTFGFSLGVPIKILK